jgi:hypothetical protein
VQDTGISAYVPPGAGLLTFSDLDSAAAALARVEADHPAHAAAFAREDLDSDKVLSRRAQFAEL